jgi:phosphatidylglycerophosphate synthase
MSAASKKAVTVEDDDLSDEDYERVSASPVVTQQQQQKRPAATSNAEDRGGLSPGEEGGFDIWLRNNVNQPILSIVPEWVNPNTLSYLNTTVCWVAFFCGFLSYQYEHVYPDACFFSRIIMALCFWASMILDCLDGMQARKTGRCSKLGEVLDHALDSANIPLCSAAMLHLLHPDQWTILISLIGGCTIYNAQLVIYRHAHVFVLPPVTGPVAQAIVGGAIICFAFFFRWTDRHTYGPMVLINLFALGGNITQLQNTGFFGKHLVSHNAIWPHIRFTVCMVLHGAMLPLGFLSINEYLFSAVLLAYRLNGSYVLDTLLSFRPYTSTHTREHVRREDVGWKNEVVAGLILLLSIGFTLGTGDHKDSVTGLPYVNDSLFHVVLYGFLVMCVYLNVSDLKKSLPALEAKQ